MTTVTAKDTTAPVIRTLRANQLVVDRTVQRSLDTRRAAAIAADFDRNALGTFVVSHRSDGTYHIIDGQHRHAVVILLDGDTWDLVCEVHEGLTRAQEARMFRLLNNSRAVGVLDKFLVRVQEGDPIAVGITTKLQHHGWTVVVSKAAGSFVAVGAIEKAYRRAGNDGPALADWVLEVVTEAFGHNVDGVRGEIITGLSLLWLRHGEAVDRPKLVNELKGYVGGPRALVGRARSLKEYRGGTVGDAMAEHLVMLINKNRRVHRLPAWDTEGED
jgi:hypothetical protein